MKILWLSHIVPYPPKGGAVQRSFNLLRELSKYHDIFLIGFIHKRPLLVKYPNLQEAIDDAETNLLKHCVNLKFLPIPSEETLKARYVLVVKSLFTKLPYTVNWLRSSQMTNQINEWVRREKFDLVHLDTISLIPYAMCFRETKKVLNHHNIESQMMLRRAKKEKNPLKRAYFLIEGKKLQAYEQRTSPLVDAHITCSKLDSERLHRIVGTSACIEEVANGVDVDFFVPEETTERPFSLLFIGGLSWYPNKAAIRYFVRDIYPLLKDKIPEVNIDVIGANPPTDIVELSKKDKNFRVHGFVKDILPFFNQASVYVCPIQDGGGTKLKVLDALAMQKAIVAHPIACEGIEVSNGKNVLLAEKPEEFVKCISLALSDYSLRKKLGQNGRKLIMEKYAYETLGHKLAYFYENIAKQCEYGTDSDAVARKPS